MLKPTLAVNHLCYVAKDKGSTPEKPAGFIPSSLPLDFPNCFAFGCEGNWVTAVKGHTCGQWEVTTLSATQGQAPIPLIPAEKPERKSRLAKLEQQGFPPTPPPIRARYQRTGNNDTWTWHRSSALPREPSTFVLKLYISDCLLDVIADPPTHTKKQLFQIDLYLGLEKLRPCTMG